jgi:hypothetical protein
MARVAAHRTLVGRCQRFEREIEDVAVGAEAFEGPREVGLRRNP